MRSVGAVFYILGFLIAGVMFIVIGSEYNKNPTDNDNLSTFYWIYAVSLFFAACGTILENGDRFCGGEEVKEVDYFGGLFQLVAVFAWAGFGVGLAHFTEDEQYWNNGDPSQLESQESADERSTLAWLSGVTAIVFAVGALLMLKELLCCDGFSCSITTAQAFANMFICILLVILWFLFADKLNSNIGETGDDDKRRDYAYIIGVIFIIFSLVGILSFLSICNFGSGGSKKPYKPRPDYGQRPSYDNKPGYGDNRPSYGDNKPGYGGQPDAGYGPPKPGYGPPQSRY